LQCKVVYNALGKASNLKLVELSRQNVFSTEEWGCILFMFAPEDTIPDENPYLTAIRYLGCDVVRTPRVQWGVFLQYVSPVFVKKFEKIAIVLDDIFIPTTGKNPMSITKLMDSMDKWNISVMTPGVVGDTHSGLNGVNQSCIYDLHFIETYVQIFTAEAWECFYGMLHHTGGSGWCYDLCFHDKCRKFRMAADYSMQVYHMNGKTPVPPKLLEDASIPGFTLDAPKSGVFVPLGNPHASCPRLNCNMVGLLWKDIIECPAAR